jgi:tetratricopeptide (TPR) repeat protein
LAFLLGSPNRAFCEEEKSAPADLLARLADAGPAERWIIGLELGQMGAEALEATRKARDAAEKPELREALSRAATWQLALKITPALREGFESQLTYDGQFSRLKEEGPEVLDALYQLIRDSATDISIRLSACRALADVVEPGGPRTPGTPASSGALVKPEALKALLPNLRQLYHDILCPYVVKEQTGFLLAILGDTHAVDSEVDRYEKLAQSENPRESTASYVQLANLYYRIRRYQKAVKCYEKLIPFYESLYRQQKRIKPPLPEEILEKLRGELALQYYNAACSNSLYGDLDKSRTLLRKAVELDPMHYNNLQKDGDLLNLRKDPGFADFLKELGKLFEKESL